MLVKSEHFVDKHLRYSNVGRYYRFRGWLEGGWRVWCVVKRLALGVQVKTINECGGGCACAVVFFCFFGPRDKHSVNENAFHCRHFRWRERCVFWSGSTTKILDSIIIHHFIPLSWIHYICMYVCMFGIEYDMIWYIIGDHTVQYVSQLPLTNCQTLHNKTYENYVEKLQEDLLNCLD